MGQQGFRNRNANIQNPAATAGQKTAQQTQQLSPYQRACRDAPRSAEIMQAVQLLDATTDEAYIEELMNWFVQAYADRQGGELVGLMAKCYLGPEFIDHQMSLEHGILQHYVRGQEVPPPFNLARPYSRNAAYEFVEVYADGEIIPVRADGSGG